MMEQASLRISATPAAIRHVLLDALALPSWNEAFLSVAEPLAGQRYGLRVRPGLSGWLEYTAIQPDRIEIAWQVPGFREIGVWTLGADGLVTHSFEHAGPLAAVLRRAYRGIAAVRLERLAARVLVVG